MLQKVSIRNIIEKETKTGKSAGSKYLVVETNEGKLSVFSQPLFDAVNKAVGKEVEVDILTVGQYRNIIGVGKVVGDAHTFQPQQNPQDRIDEATRLRRRTDLTMKAYEGYLAGKIDREKVLDEAISLIEFVEDK